MVKHLPANAEDVRDSGSVPGLGRSPGGRQNNTVQYCCLENPVNRATWQDRVHRVATSPTRDLVHTGKLSKEINKPYGKSVLASRFLWQFSLSAFPLV